MLNILVKIIAVTWFEPYHYDKLMNHKHLPLVSR